MKNLFRTVSKKMGLVIALQLIVFSAFGQFRVITKTYQDFQTLQHLKAADSKENTLEGVEGSPYLNPKFEKGVVLTENKVRYVGIPLRYNVYNDEIEFQNSKGQAMSVQFPGNIKEVKIGHKIFVYHLFFVSPDKITWGYLQQIIRGKANGFIRYRTIFVDAQPALAYKDAQPPKFVPQPSYYYVSLGKKPAVRVQNTRGLIKLLGNHKKELEAFAKKNKIKVRRLTDFRRILYYYNSLP